MRGDEVVSLGWCFWHWGCFGCLVCGERMTVPENDDVVDNGGEGKKREQNRSWGSWDTGTDAKRRRCLGVELSEIPVCRVCTIETAGESRGEVLERGLETVDRFDGGLSRDRLGMLGDEGKTDLKVGKRRKLQPVRRSRGSRSQKTTKSGDRDVSLDLLGRSKTDRYSPEIPSYPWFTMLRTWELRKMAPMMNLRVAAILSYQTLVLSSQKEGPKSTSQSSTLSASRLSNQAKPSHCRNGCSYFRTMCTEKETKSGERHINAK